MEAPTSYLPVAKEAVDANRPPSATATESADEEIVLFNTRSLQNTASGSPSPPDPARAWKLGGTTGSSATDPSGAAKWKISEDVTNATKSDSSTATESVTAADTVASGAETPSAKASAPASETDGAGDASSEAGGLTDAFQALKVTSVPKAGAQKRDPAEVAFPNVHSVSTDYRAPPPPRPHPTYHYDQRVLPHQGYPDQQQQPPLPSFGDHRHQAPPGEQSPSDWPHTKPVRKGSEEHTQYGRAPVNDFHRGGYGAAGAGAVGVPHQYTSPGYLTPGPPTYGPPAIPHVPLHTAYGHHQQQGMYEMVLSPNPNDVSGAGPRGGLPGYGRPAPAHHPSSEHLGLVGGQPQQQPQQGQPFSPMSPSPIHNPYAHHPHHAHHIQSYVPQALPPQHTGSQQSRVGVVAPYPGGLPIHQHQNGYPTFYDDPYSQQAQQQQHENALYARYNSSPHMNGVVAGGNVGAVGGVGAGATSPYGAPPVSPYPPQALVSTAGGQIPPPVAGAGGILPVGTDGQNGPSANNRKLGLYKTELCRSWEEKGSCRYGPKCQFAHGEEEIRKVARHPKYKTEICRTFWVSGSCPYGKRCCFIHTELPAPGAPGNPNPPPPGGVEGRSPGGSGPVTASAAATPDAAGHARTTSTGSDPSDQPSSLLARISAKRGNAEFNGATTSDSPRTEGASNGTAAYPFPGPPTPASAGTPTPTANGAAAPRPDFSHNRHLSTLSDGRTETEGTSFSSVSGQRPGHSHSASAHSLVTPTFAAHNTANGGAPYGRQQFSAAAAGQPDAAAAGTNGNGLASPAYWHKRSASGGSVNASWNNAAQGSESSSREDQTATQQPLRSIYTSLTTPSA